MENLDNYLTMKIKSKIFSILLLMSLILGSLEIATTEYIYASEVQNYVDDYDIEEVLKESGENTQFTPDEISVGNDLTSNGNEISLPEDAEDGIKISGEDYPSSLTLTIPNGDEVTEIIDDDETLTYVNEDETMATSIQIDEETDSLRESFTFYEDQGSEIKIPLKIEGLKNPEYTIDENGVVITDENMNLENDALVLTKPWAKDADGNDLVTRYVVEDNILYQEIDTDQDTVYPITADPVYSKIVKTVIKFLKRIGRTIGSGAALTNFCKYNNDKNKAFDWACDSANRYKDRSRP